MKVDNVVWVSPEELIPYEKNAKAHPISQVEKIANSIKAFGWTQPIVVDKDNVVVIGHGRLMAAKELKLEKVPVVMRDDLSEEQVKALRLADNKTNESEWISGKLSEELADLAIAGYDMEQFGFDVGDIDISENPYTQKTDIPQYDVTGKDVSISDLYADEKTKDLIAEINNSTLSEAEKEFLRIAAYRHVVFNYQNIAEYYAKADRQLQWLMEKSALVIIDIDDAIKNGYTLLKETISNIVLEEMAEDE